MKSLPFLFILLACSPADLDRRPVNAGSFGVASFDELFDSLATAGDCPRSDLPPIRPFDIGDPAFDAEHACGIVAAAIRRLGSQPAAEPNWAPADTASIIGASLGWSVVEIEDLPLDVSVQLDSALRVELDIQERPRLVWIEYRLKGQREEFGAVHR